MTDRHPDYRGRFAPSPTGPLHFGSLVAAVASYLEARARGGAWLLRVDDIDPPREVPGAARAIVDMLATYGMEPDEPVAYQSALAARHAAALAQLERAGRLFACACSRSDLEGHRVYPGTCREGVPAGRVARSLRARVTVGRLAIQDAIQGRYTQYLDREIGDFVVRRADGYIAYHLACVVGDAAQGITGIVRGADLLPSTPQQVFLQRLLGLPIPAYAHVPVVMGDDGRKLSKQTRAAPVDRESRRPTLMAALAFLGHPVPRAVRCGSFAALWRWALDNWRLARVPARNALASRLGTGEANDAQSPNHEIQSQYP